MASRRPYREALGIKTALDEIESGKSILYDADIVDTVLHLFLKKAYTIK
jgi:HD-GYP domain-containing protein (c-di-GMP phosphodiesterase class II)